MDTTHHNKESNWEGLVVETAERLVINYANLSGREDANRAEFRKRAIELLRPAFLSVAQETRGDTLKEAIKVVRNRSNTKAYSEGDNELARENKAGWNSCLAFIGDLLTSLTAPTNK